MIFEFGTAAQISGSIYSILAISVVLSSLMCLLVYKVFGANKWAVLSAGVLMVSASLTFSSVNLSAIFYRLQLNEQQLALNFAFPNDYQQSFATTEFVYIDAVTPNPKKDLCHIALEDKQSVLYQSLDIPVKRCEQIQQQLMQILQLKARPPKPKSSHAPPPLPAHIQP